MGVANDRWAENATSLEQIEVMIAQADACLFDVSTANRNVLRIGPHGQAARCLSRRCFLMR